MRDETPQRFPDRNMLPTVQRLFIYFAVALALGVLGAKRFAVAAGVNSHYDEPIVACGVVLGLLVLALLIALVHFGRQVVAVLARSQSRPGPTVGLVLIICGTVCLLAALGTQLYESGRTVSGSTTLSVPAAGGSARVDVQASDSFLLTPVITAAVLLAGAALVALGLWSSSSPRTVPYSPPPAGHDSPPPGSAHVSLPVARSPHHTEGGEPGP
jgi:hypothetical protein